MRSANVLFAQTIWKETQVEPNLGRIYILFNTKQSRFTTQTLASEDSFGKTITFVYVELCLEAKFQWRVHINKLDNKM